jgi:hypothetical protein
MYKSEFMQSLFHTVTVGNSKEWNKSSILTKLKLGIVNDCCFVFSEFHEIIFREYNDIDRVKYDI